MACTGFRNETSFFGSVPDLKSHTEQIPLKRPRLAIGSRFVKPGFWRVAFFCELQHTVFKKRLYYHYFAHPGAFQPLKTTYLIPFQRMFSSFSGLVLAR